MKAKFTTLIVLLCCQFAFAQQRGVVVTKTNADGSKQEVQLYDGSYALIIGNSEYSMGWNRLGGVKSDVAAVRDVLQKHGFKVEVEENLTSERFETRVRKFINDYGYDRDNRLIIYYAGHGHTLNSVGDKRELGYIVPIDAPLPAKDERGFRQKAVSMYAIQTFARNIQAKHALFIFDSCFSGKIFALRATPKITPFIVDKIDYPVRQFITAGDETQSVPDESIFRKAFVRGLDGDADRNNDGYITGTELADYLKEIVTNYTNRGQTPQYGVINDVDLDKGDLVFAKYAPATVPAPTLQSPPRSDRSSKGGEQLFWEEMERRNTIESYQNYLAEYPAGEFVRIAKLKWAGKRWETLKVTAKKILKYEYVASFSEGLASLRVGSFPAAKWGFIDGNGNEIIPVKYDSVSAFSNGLALVKLNKQFIFIDKTGKEVITTAYDFVESFKEGLARVIKENPTSVKHGFIDVTGREVVPIKYDRVESFSDGLAMVNLKDKYGFIDKRGTEVISLKYDFAGSFSEGLALVRSDDKYFYINGVGTKVITLRYSSFSIFTEGMSRVSSDKKTGHKAGFIDKTGQLVLPFKYDSADSFSEGLVAVRVGDYYTGKFGFIDKTGKEITPVKYKYVDAFSDGLARVWLDNKVGFVDRTGREIIEPKFTSVWCEAFRNEGFIGVILNGKKGFVDLYGNEYFDF